MNYNPKPGETWFISYPQFDEIFITLDVSEFGQITAIPIFRESKDGSAYTIHPIGKKTTFTNMNTWAGYKKLKKMGDFSYVEKLVYNVNN